MAYQHLQRGGPVLRGGGAGVGARDSKNPAGPTLAFGIGQWRRFLGAPRDDRLNGA
ncbi:DUF397 domain-containing protein [Actinosynnema sp. NPDC023658]|uniref:DUF397 domain-containing protein n=1 Tax=Actinosynnema sp. NPDC023658 TaxID=3155465 RepID=UPI0033E187C7